MIIGKCMPHKQGSTIINKDTSVALKSNERGYIDRNCFGDRYFTNVTGDGYTFAKVGPACGWRRVGGGVCAVVECLIEGEGGERGRRACRGGRPR